MYLATPTLQEDTPEAPALFRAAAPVQKSLTRAGQTFTETGMLFTYFKEIPKEIIEAGKMDGVSIWGEIKDIVLPLAWGGLASTALLCFIFCWNEAYWTVRLTTIDAATLSKLIEGNRAPEGLFFGRLSAVSTAAVGPIVVLGWLWQKQLVPGLTFGAVK